MNIEFACPRCEQPARVEFDPDSTAVACPHCEARLAVPDGAFVDGQLCRCLVCPSNDLFVRKDFPQRLGFWIVVVGFIASCFFWAHSDPIWAFVCLFIPAIIDFVLYLFVGDALMCYRCGAMYRRLGDLENYPQFQLETHEKHRQELARLEQSQPLH